MLPAVVNLPGVLPPCPSHKSPACLSGGVLRAHKCGFLKIACQRAGGSGGEAPGLACPSVRSVVYRAVTTPKQHLDIFPRFERGK